MGFFDTYTTKKPQCIQCGLHLKCNSPKMDVYGNGSKKILFISSEITPDADRAKVPIYGKNLQTIRIKCQDNNIKYKEDCWTIPAIRCSAEGIKPKTIEYCSPLLYTAIKKLQPKKIILLGELAVSTFYNDRSISITLQKVAGKRIWDSTYDCWVYPIWDVDTYNEKSYDKLFRSEFDRCFSRIFSTPDKKLKKKWNDIHTLLNYKDAIRALKRTLKHDKVIAVDYETTGLTIFKTGHKTVSFAWANSKGSWATLLEHPYYTKKQQSEIKKYVKRILNSRNIKKIVHNLNYEYVWTLQQLKTQPENFFYDTQLASHVLDNRGGISGLKFQAFIRWGIEDYDSASKPYISSNGGDFNNMLKMPVDALLKYNALDTLYTYELYKEQLTEFAGDELKAYKFFHKGLIALCEMTYNGICVSASHYEKQRKALEKDKKILLKKIYKLPEVRKFRTIFKKEFDYSSPKDLQRILFKVLKLKSIKKTKTGDSVDAEVLSKLNIPLTRRILAVRKLDKLISTYIEGFLKHASESIMHPTFSLNRARSFRSSSSNPNFQNIPKRDPVAKKVVRSGMIPRKGNVLGEMDFSGAEISTSCYFHKDPVFIEYQTEGGGDMHKDAAAEILKLNKDEVAKQIRQATKGVWTFAQFYGSYYVSCAKKGWEEYPLLVDADGNPLKVRGIEIGDYLNKTFGNYKSFENHLKKFQDKFWNEWFKVYTKWKDDVCDFYIKNGYVETPLGFRFKGLMDRNKCTNYPIQGSSFHLLLYTIIEVHRILKKKKMKTLIIGQIHDSLVLDIPIDEIKKVAKILKKVVGSLHKKHKWMDFPMGLDFEISAPYEKGGTFAAMTKYDM